MTIKLTATRTTEKSSWYYIEEIGIKVCGKKNVEAIEAYINNLSLPVEVPPAVETIEVVPEEFYVCDLPDGYFNKFISEKREEVEAEHDISLEDDENLVPDAELTLEEELDIIDEGLNEHGFEYVDSDDYDHVYNLELEQETNDVTHIKAYCAGDNQEWYFEFKEANGGTLEEFFPEKSELIVNGEFNHKYITELRFKL